MNEDREPNVADATQEQGFGFKLPPEAIRLSELINPIVPWAIRVVTTLRVPDLISQGVTGVEDIAAKAEVNADALNRVLRLLTYSDVFTQPEPGVYANTPVSELLRTDHPMQMHGWLDLEGASCRWDAVHIYMLKAVQTGQPVYTDLYGRSFWDDISANKKLSESFDSFMEQIHSWSVGDIVAGYDWSGAGHVVDVGGGSGFLLAEILRANEGLRGTLVDKPSTAQTTAERDPFPDLGGRLRVVGGSFFDDLPAGAGVYIVSSVLHNWGDEDAVRILANCAEAAGAGGTVLIVEGLIDGGEDQKYDCETDVLMLVALGGRKRTVGEFRSLVAKAGLTLRSEHITPSGQSLLECVRA
jgi:SAM-dependent methyltransferase